MPETTLEDLITYFRTKIQEENYSRLKREYASGLALDIGCADGPSFSSFVGTHVIGIDINLDERATKRASVYGVDLIMADAHHLPLKNNSASIILCQEVLEHLRHPNIALKEILRVLKQSGRSYITVPCLLDKITVPALTPVVILLERLAKVTLWKNVEQGGSLARKTINLSISRLPVNYISKLGFRFLQLLLSVRYCMKEHRNKYAWSWIPIIRSAGFTIEKIDGCAILYPLAFACPKPNYIYNYEKKFRAKYPFNYLGQLLCIVVRPQIVDVMLKVERLSGFTFTTLKGFRNLREFYERAYAYRRCAGSSLAETHNISLSIASIGQKDAVLEVGCGAGSLLAQISKRAATTVGLDVSGFLIIHAKRRSPDMSLVVGDAQALPFRSDVFTKCFAVEVLEHVPFPDLLTKEIHRILKDDGEAIIVVPNDRNWRVYRIFQGHLREAFYNYGHLHDLSTPEKLKPFIKDYSILAIKENKAFLIPTRRIMALLFTRIAKIKFDRKLSFLPRLTLHLIIKLRKRSGIAPP